MRLTCIAGAVVAASLSSLLLAPTPVVAQPGGVSAACTIDPNSPTELALQSLAFQRARGAKDATERQRLLMGLMKELDTKPERFARNPAGYQYLLSQALLLWAAEPGIGQTPTRGQLGLVANPAQPYDIVVHMDSAFTRVQAAAPECAKDVADLRQNDVWLALTRSALDASNTGKLDSAEYYAKRSMLLSNQNPYPSFVLANVATARKEYAAAVSHWQKVIEIAGTDTSYRDLRNSSLFNLSNNQLQLAETQSGEARQRTARDAAATIKTLLAIVPGSTDAPNLLSNWSDALVLAGDSAQVATVYADLLTNPVPYSDISLSMAGVIATRIKRSDDALRLFELAVQKNGTARDALRNLAATYYSKEQYQKMFEPTAKLLELDPNNFDGWMMYAYASQGLMKTAKTPALKKAWTDSLVKYQSLAEALPVKVDVAGFTRGVESSTVILSLAQAAPTPGQYAVTVEFLDQNGAVVASGTESVGPIKTGERKQVTISAAGGGIVGYRYKALK